MLSCAPVSHTFLCDVIRVAGYCACAVCASQRVTGEGSSVHQIREITLIRSYSVASEESQILERASETRTGRCTMAEKESVTIVKQGLLQKRGERSWIIYWLFPLFYRRVH